MEKSLNIANQLRHWNKGTFNVEDLDILALAGWTAFACKSSALTRKTEILFRRLEQIVFNPMFDLSECTAVLKNILENGKAMDIIEIRKIETGKLVCSIFYKHSETGLAGVLNPKGESLASGSWDEIKEFIMSGDLKVPSTRGIVQPEVIERPKAEKPEKEVKEAKEPKAKKEKAPKAEKAVKAKVVKPSKKAAKVAEGEPTDSDIEAANAELAEAIAE